MNTVLINEILHVLIKAEEALKHSSPTMAYHTLSEHVYITIDVTTMIVRLQSHLNSRVYYRG